MSFDSSQVATGQRPCTGTACLRCSPVAVPESGLTWGQQEPCTAGPVPMSVPAVGHCYRWTAHDPQPWEARICASKARLQPPRETA